MKYMVLKKEQLSNRMNSIVKTIKVSSKGQIVIPLEIRKKQGLKDEVVVIYDERGLRIYPKQKDLAKYSAGLGKELWKSLGGGDAYLKQERKSWD